MSKRGRGRPKKTEHDAFGELLWLERLLEEETTALRRQGHKPTKALERAAVRLGISERVAWRQLAEIKRENERFTASIAAFAALWRELYGTRLEKNDGTDLLAGHSCSAD